MSKDFLAIISLTLVVVAVPVLSVFQSNNLAVAEEVSSSSESSVSEVLPTLLEVKSVASEEFSVSTTRTEPKNNSYVFSRDYFKVYDKGSEKIINVSVDDYVLGAIAAEMPSTFHREALIAQGISALSYAVFNANRAEALPNGADFEVNISKRQGYVTEDRIKEFYGDSWEYHYNKIKDAAEVAKKYVMTYENEPIAAAYHAISSGDTEASENVWGEALPYLSAVPSSSDILAKDYSTTVIFSPEELKEKLSIIKPKLLPDTDTWLEIISRSSSGYVTEIRVGNQSMSGLDFRNILGLRSSAFTITRQGKAFVFTVNGYGHGVGLSQNGADYMARQGMGYKEILEHYYKGATLSEFSTKG